jgi:hypothetical protein
MGTNKATKQAQQAATQADNVYAGSQTEALNYLKDLDKLPRGIRESALTGLSSYFHVPDQPKTQQQLIDEAKSSPLYASILGSRQAGEQSILRNASATGGLRSGNASADLSDYGMQLENNALLMSFNEAQDRDRYERALQLSGMEDLAELPSGGQAIAGLTAGIGLTRAQGITAAAQAGQVGAQNNMDNFMKILQIGLMAGNVGGFGLAPQPAYCDIRLKRNIKHIGERDGYNWYRWDWCSEAQDKLGLPEHGEGVMAHEVYEVKPEAVGLCGPFLCVNYDLLREAA